MTHDYDLSIDELLEKSEAFGAIPSNLSQVSEDQAIENSYKALYFGCLGTLKNHFKHPYDAIIFNAEDLALKNRFKDANDLLCDLLSEYIKKDVFLQDILHERITKEQK